MRALVLTCIPVLLLSVGCQNIGIHTDVEATSAKTSEPIDVEHRGHFLGEVQALEGRWRDEANGETVFAVTSAGSVVRETMFPGQAHEMVNMYSMDGNDLRMTHYCGAGNQPHMRASAVTGSKIEFQPDGVSDLKSPGANHMGSMTLVLVDENHIEQHWTSYENGEAGPVMVFKYERVD